MEMFSVFNMMKMIMKIWNPLMTSKPDHIL